MTLLFVAVYITIFPNITEIIFDYQLCFMATSVYTLYSDTIVTVH